MNGVSPIAHRLAATLKNEVFTLIDVGCSGGIAPGWRIFGDGLRAFGFDPNRQEVRRLAQQETHPSVRYVEGFVGLPEGHPLKGASKDPWRVDPWGRLSASRTQELQAARTAEPDEGAPRLSPEDMVDRNLWRETELVDSAQTIVLPQFLAEHGIDDVDFVKIDVDGSDFEVLQSLGDRLSDPRMLGLMLEVNFFGSAEAQYNSFHNIDRHMRSRGYELLDLSVRRYSLSALPSPYLYPHPLASQTVSGRPFQGDAVYMRDFGYPWDDRTPDNLSDEKLLKLLVLYILMEKPDHAAELLRLRPERFSNLDVQATLDALSVEAQSSWPGQYRATIQFDDYKAHIAAYEADDPRFYAAEARIETERTAQQQYLMETLAQLTKAESEAEILRARLEATFLERDQARASLDEMRRSTSWQLTRPLRHLRGLKT